MMTRKTFLYLLLLAGLSLLVACNEKQTPPLTSIPVEEIQQTLDAKQIFRYSDYGNTSSWVVPDDKGNLMIQLGKETYMHNSYRTVWDNRDNAIPFYFTMKGHGEGSARIDIPLAGDSQAVDVPFSFEVPWSLSSDSVPETYTRLVAFGLGQRGQFDFVFGDDTPFSRIVTDIRVFFPESFTVKVASTHHMSEKNAFRYYVELNPSYPFSTDVSLTSACVVPEEYQSLPGHAIQLDSVVTVTGTLHLEKSALKEGWEWPDHLDVSCSLNHQGDVYRTHGAVNLPSEYPLPDISFEYDLRIRPYAFQWGKPNIHLYDTRLRMNFLNKTPFKVRLRGTVASYKDGIILHSVPFGNDIPLEAKRFNSTQAFYSGDSSCEKRIILSEFNRFPVSLPEPYAEGDQEHASLQIAGLSSLFAGDPDDIRFTDLRVERDPDEIVRIDSEEASFKLHGRVDTPFQVEKDFSAQTYTTLYFPRNLFAEDLILDKVIVEGTLTSTLPFQVELEDALGMDDVTVSLNKVVLPPSLGGKASSAGFRIQLESSDNLKDRMNTSLIFRLSADETCIGKPVNESAGLSLTDVVIKYQDPLDQ